MEVAKAKTAYDFYVVPQGVQCYIKTIIILYSWKCPNITSEKLKPTVSTDREGSKIIMMSLFNFHLKKLSKWDSSQWHINLLK